MLTIFKKISYLILLNICMVNHSDASFFSFFKKLTSSNNDSNEQVFDKNNKPIELKVQVNSSILDQIKEINNILEDKNDNNKIRDNNFDTIQTQQQRILGVLGSYHYNKDVFNKCIIKVKSTISVIDFYNSLFKQRNDFSKSIVELCDILKDQYTKSINELCKSFNKMLSIVNLINIIFSESNDKGLINNILLLDNTIGLNENEIKNILNPFFHKLDLVLDKDTIDYYNDILSEFNAKIRQKNSILPSQLLFILFNIIREELLINNNELYKSYIFFKNKTTIINQKLDSINTHIKDTKQLSSDNESNKKSHEEIIVDFINTNIKEQNRNNSDVIDEIERVRNAIDDIIEFLNDFKNYVPDEKILSAIEQSKTNKKESKNQNNKTSNSNDSIKETKNETSNTTIEQSNKDKNNTTNSNNKDSKDKSTENEKTKSDNNNKEKDLSNKENKNDNKPKDKENKSEESNKK